MPRKNTTPRSKISSGSKAAAYGTIPKPAKQRKLIIPKQPKAPKVKIPRPRRTPAGQRARMLELAGQLHLNHSFIPRDFIPSILQNHPPPPPQGPITLNHHYHQASPFAQAVHEQHQANAPPERNNIERPPPPPAPSPASTPDGDIHMRALHTRYTNEVVGSPFSPSGGENALARMMDTHTGTSIINSGSNVHTLADLGRPKADHVTPRKLIEELQPRTSYGSGALGGSRATPKSSAEFRQAAVDRYDTKARFERYTAKVNGMSRAGLIPEMTRVGLKYHKSSGNKLVPDMRKELLQRFHQKPELFYSV